MRNVIIPTVGGLTVLLAIGLATITPRHETAVDRPTIKRPLPAPEPWERATGRRWFILRTGGIWR